MIKRMTIFFVIIFSISLNFAIPYTTLGEMKVPTAYVMPDKMFGISYISYFAARAHQEHEHDFGIVVTYSAFNRVEMGAVYNGEAGFMMNVKGLLVEEHSTTPAVSIGVDNLFSEMDVTDKEEHNFYKYDYINPDDYTANSFYVVASKTSMITFIPVLKMIETKMHLGVGNNRFEGNAEISKRMGGLFLGAEIRSSVIENLSFLGEMDGYNLNFGIKYRWNNLIFRTGMYRWEENTREGAKPKFAFNIKYVFDNWAGIGFSEWIPRANQRPGYPGTPVVNNATLQNGNQGNDPFTQIQEQDAENMQKMMELLEKMEKEQKTDSE